MGTMEGYAGGVQWVQWRDNGGYCGGIEWGPMGEYTHTMLKTHKMCDRRIHVCDLTAAIKFCGFCSKGASQTRQCASFS